MNIKTNGNSESIRFDGGKATVAVYGDFGGAIVTLQASFGGTWVTIMDDLGDDIEFTKDTCRNLEIAGCNLRAVVTGGSTINLAFLIQPIFNNPR